MAGFFVRVLEPTPSKSPIGSPMWPAVLVCCMTAAFSSAAVWSSGRKAVFQVVRRVLRDWLIVWVAAWRAFWRAWRAVLRGLAACPNDVAASSSAIASRVSRRVCWRVMAVSPCVGRAAGVAVDRCVVAVWSVRVKSACGSLEVPWQIPGWDRVGSRGFRGGAHGSATAVSWSSRLCVSPGP